MWLRLLLFAVLLGSSCQCSTRVTTPKQYHGDPHAAYPYADKHIKRTTINNGCTRAWCSKTIMIRVRLHNPTRHTTTFDVACFFYDGEDNYQVGGSSHNNVRVPPRRSLTVELQDMVRILKEHNLAGVYHYCETKKH